MIEPRPTSDRPFAASLISATLMVFACVAGLTFLRSNQGRLLFIDEGSMVTLVAAEPGDSADRFVLRGRPDGRVSKRLGKVALETRPRYLLITDLAPGGRLTFVARYQGKREKLNFRSRLVATEYHRFLDTSGPPGALRLHAVNEGPHNVEILGVRVAPISSLYFWLRAALRITLWLTPILFLLAHRRRLTRALSRADPVDDSAFALIVFGLCFFAFHSAPVDQVVDSRFLTAVSHSVIHGRGVTLPENFRAAEEARRYQLDRIGDRLLPHFSPMPAILDAPVVAAYERFGVSPLLSGGRWDRGKEIRLMRFSAALVSALLCVVLYLIARAYLPPLQALGLTFAFAFGSQIFSTLSRPYWSHGWGALLSATAILLILRPWRGREAASAVLAATSVSLAFYCRPQTVWTVIGLVVLLAASRSWRRLVAFTATGLIWVVVGGLLSQTIYESVVPSYFFASQVAKGRLTAEPLGSYRYVTGALGALFSPGRGLFIYSPLCLWALYQTARRWKSLPSRAWGAIALGVIVAHLWLLVHTGVWPGGQSYGARLFSDVLIWFFLLAALSAEALRRTWPTLSIRARWAQVTAASLVLVFAVFVNARGAWSRATWTWESFDRPPVWMTDGREPLLPQPEHWNWRHPQFLAGLLPLDPQRPTEDGSPEE